METVFNLLESEFPPAEHCKAATDLLKACQALLAAGSCHAVGCSHVEETCSCHKKLAKEAITKASINS